MKCENISIRDISSNTIKNIYMFEKKKILKIVWTLKKLYLLQSP